MKIRMSAMLLAEVVLLLATLAVSNSNIVTDLYAKYSNSQAQSLVNECGQDESSGINCVANGPQTQADGSANATPIVSNAGGQGQQGPPGPRGPPGPPGLVEDLDIETTQRGSEPVIIHPGATDHATASCNPDEKITGGGFTTSGNLDVITSLREGDTNDWVAGANNPSSQDGTIIAVVECAKLV